MICCTSIVYILLLLKLSIDESKCAADKVTKPRKIFKISIVIDPEHGERFDDQKIKVLALFNEEFRRFSAISASGEASGEKYLTNDPDYIVQPEFINAARSGESSAGPQ